MLGGTLAAVLAVGVAAGVGRELRRAALLALGLALLVAAINPLVSSEGLTVLVRGGTFLGRRWDITLEAVAYGAVAALRVVVLVLACALFSAVVDPDELLRLLRRISYRSALTAALATRLVPVLARDGARMGEAARCRPESARPRRGDRARRWRARWSAPWTSPPPSRCAATAAPGGPPRVPRPWSRHDVRVGASAAAIAALALSAKLAAGRVLHAISHDLARGRAGRAGAGGGHRGAGARAVRGGRRPAGGGACLSRS